MKARCPSCENTDLVIKKLTVGKRGVTVDDYFCPKCGLLETINCDEPGWKEKIERWRSDGGKQAHSTSS